MVWRACRASRVPRASLVIPVAVVPRFVVPELVLFVRLYLIYSEENNFWLWNLKGPQGFPGPTGPDGYDGLQGPRGPKGVKVGRVGEDLSTILCIPLSKYIPNVIGWKRRHHNWQWNSCSRTSWHERSSRYSGTSWASWSRRRTWPTRSSRSQGFPRQLPYIFKNHPYRNLMILYCWLL